MTVKELMDKLATLPLETPIGVYDECGDPCLEISCEMKTVYEIKPFRIDQRPTLQESWYGDQDRIGRTFQVLMIQ